MDANKAIYRDILKSTSIVGLTHVLVMLIGIIRTKIVAILLGTHGIGILGLLQSIIDLIRGVSGLGISISSIRNIAEANEAKDLMKFSKAVIIMRRWILITAFLGMVITITFRNAISLYTFGSADYAFAIAILSFAIGFSAISATQTAILQGLRKLKTIALCNILTALVGTLVVSLLYYQYGLSGIVPGLIIMSFLSFIIPLAFTRKIEVVKMNLSLRQTFVDGFGMAKLGFFTVITSLVTTGALYLSRATIVKALDVNALGVFQAAYGISVVYLGLILNSISLDFFPRISAVNADSSKVKILLNSQTKLALTLGTPIVVLMIVFSDVIIYTFYSKEFVNAVPLLKLFAVASFFRVLAWPIGYYLLAKNNAKQYLFCEITMMLLFYGILRLGVPVYGLWITGVALISQYIYYIIISLSLIQKESGLLWDSQLVVLAAVNSTFVALSYAGSYLDGDLLHYFLEIFVVGACLCYSLLNIHALINIKEVHQRLKSYKFFTRHK